MGMGVRGEWVCRGCLAGCRVLFVFVSVFVFSGGYVWMDVCACRYMYDYRHRYQQLTLRATRAFLCRLDNQAPPSPPPFSKNDAAMYTVVAFSHVVVSGLRVAALGESWNRSYTRQTQNRGCGTKVSALTVVVDAVAARIQDSTARSLHRL